MLAPTCAPPLRTLVLPPPRRPLPPPLAPRLFFLALRQYREFHADTYFHRDCYARRVATIFISALQPPQAAGVAGKDDPEPPEEHKSSADITFDTSEGLSGDAADLQDGEDGEEAAQRHEQQNKTDKKFMEQGARHLEPPPSHTP